MSQELRNKIYATSGALAVVLVTFGIVSVADADTANQLLEQLIKLIGEAITLFGLIVAFVKSLPGKTTTLDIPRASVESVNTTDGSVLAGPASPAPDGTVLTPPTGG